MIEHLMETLISSQNVFDGRMIRLCVDTVRLPDGKETTREVVKHPGAVAIIAETEAGGLLLVTQYRYPVRLVSLELPAGKLDRDESLESAAFRELLEETGYRAQQLTKVMDFYSTPGFSDEIMHLYIARGLTFDKMQPDEDEFIDCREYTRDEVTALVRAGQIKDAKTLIGVYHWLYGDI